LTTLSECDVNIWYRDTASLDRDAVEATNRHLSIEEKHRSNRLFFDCDRRDFTAAHDLLRQALSSYARLSPSDWQFSIDARGKPSIDSSDPKLRDCSFSLSHTQGFVACALARNLPVGIDVERIDQSLPSQEIADRYFSGAEAQELRDCSDDLRAVRFVEMWTLKEAFLKAVGAGHFGSVTDISFQFDEHHNIDCFTSPLTGFQSWQFALFEPLSNVRMSVATAGSSPLRYFFHPYDGQTFTSVLATPSKHSAATNRPVSSL